MQFALALPLALAACGGSSPPPPPHTLPPPARAKLEAMSWEDRCDAVAPRAKPCMDEIIVADVEGLGAGSDVVDIVREGVDRMGKSTDEEANSMHRTECAADEDYPLDVVTCWSRPDCRQFATCVKHERRARADRRDDSAMPDEPATLDER